MGISCVAYLPALCSHLLRLHTALADKMALARGMADIQQIYRDHVDKSGLMPKEKVADAVRCHGQNPLNTEVTLSQKLPCCILFRCTSSPTLYPRHSLTRQSFEQA